MASVGSVYVDLLLRDAKYTEGWNRARNTSRSAVGAIQGDVGKLSATFTAVLNPITNVSTAIQQLGLTIATALSVDKLVKYTDTWRQMSGRLSLVTSSMGEVAAVQAQLLQVAQDTRQPLADVVDFYSRLNQFIPEAVRGQYDLIGVTKSVTSALAITGETTISAQNAMIQFTQGIGTNFEAAGQELRSLQELAPRLTQALQKALGDGKQSLQALVKAGKITRQSVLDALSGVGIEGQKLAAELERVPVTVAQAFTRLDNALLNYIGNSKDAQEFTGGIALAVSALADNFDTLAKAAKGVVAVLTVAGGVAGASAAWAAFSKSLVGVNLGFIALTATTWNTQLAFIALSGSLKAVGAAFLTLATNPFVLTFVALSTAAVLLATKTDYAAESTKKYNKILGETKTALTSYSKQSEAAQVKSMAFADANIQAAEQELEALVAKSQHFQEQKSFFSEGWEGLKDFFGTEDSFTAISEQIRIVQEKYKALLEMKRRALTPEGVVIDSTTSLADLQAATETANRYKYAINGVTKEFQNYQDALESVKKAEKIGTIKPEDAKKISTSLRKAYEESTPAFQAAKKHAEELKQIYEEFRPVILGISKEQDTYNQNLAKLAQIRGSMSEEAYARALQEQYDILNKTAEKQKEAEGTYEKYETYLTGLTDQQIKYNQAQKELQGLVGKDIKGSTISQEQADTALKRYEASLKDSEEKTKDWAKMVEEMGKRAADNIQDAFADFLYDPFKDGMDGMVVNFANAIRKMYAELLASQLFQLMNKGIGDGGIGGFISSLFGGGGGSAVNLSTGVSSNTSSFLSAGAVDSTSGINFAGFFADGGYIAPGKWGIAGEAGAELIYGGNTGATVIPQSGSGGTVVNIINNNGSKVATSSSKSGNTTTIDVMIDEAVANNMTKTGSRTRQAMGSYNQRSLVRR